MLGITRFKWTLVAAFASGATGLSQTQDCLANDETALLQLSNSLATGRGEGGNERHEKSLEEQPVQPQLVQPQPVQPQLEQPQPVEPQPEQSQLVQPQPVPPQLVQPQPVKPQPVVVQGPLQGLPLTTSAAATLPATTLPATTLLATTLLATTVPATSTAEPVSTSTAAPAGDPKATPITQPLAVGVIVPFGREDTSRELQTHAARTQDTLVDAIENAEVAEIKRSVFRALTRLRAAEIKEFDTIARLETQAIDEYNDNHHYRKENPLEYLSKDATPVSEDKYAAFHG